jgi:hypothetical protein
MSQPTKDVRVAPQLFQRIDLGIFVTEKKEEIADDTAVLTTCSWSEGARDVLDSTREQTTERMLKRSLAGEIHDDISGARLTICATARAYCWYTSSGVTSI